MNATAAAALFALGAFSGVDVTNTITPSMEIPHVMLGGALP